MAQVIAFAFSPLLTRIYSPEVFGLQGVFLSLVSILGPVVALRYPLAIVVAKSDAEAMSLMRLSLQVAVVMAALLFFIILIAGDGILRMAGAAQLGAWVFFLPVALILVTLQDVHDYLAARLGVFQLAGKVEILQAVFSNSARVLGGLVSPVAAVLVSVTTLSPAVKAGLLRAGARSMRASTPSLNYTETKALIQRHREFPIYRMPTDVLNAVSQSVPVIMLSALFTPAAAGLYVLARSVVNLPLNVLGTAIGNVFYARFAEMQREGRALFPMAAKATLFQLLIPGTGLAITSFFFPVLFSKCFGEVWREAGVYAQWICLWIIGMLTNVPSVRALPIIRQQKWHLIFNGVICAGGVFALLLGHNSGEGAVGTIAWYSSTLATLYALQIVTYLLLIKRFDAKAKAGG